MGLLLTMPVCQWYVLQEGQDPLTIWLAERYHGAFALAVLSPPLAD